MAFETDLTIKVSADSDNAVSALKKVSDSTETLRKEMDNLKKLLKIAAITTEFMNIVNAADEANRAVSKVNKTLKSLGIDSKEIVSQFRDVADGLQKITKFDDEDILSAMATLTRITGDYNVALKNANLLTAISKSTGQGLEEVAIGLSRAFNGNTRALMSWGVQVKDGAKGMEVLNAVTEKFKGFLPEGELNDFNGLMAQSKNAIGEIHESLGKYLLPSVIEFQKELNKLLFGLADWNDKSKGVGSSIVAMTAGLGAMTLAITGLNSGLLKVKEALKEIKLIAAANPFLAIAAGITIAVTALTEFGNKYMDVQNEAASKAILTPNMIKDTEKYIADSKLMLEQIKKVAGESSRDYINLSKSIDTAEKKLIGLKHNLEVNKKPKTSAKNTSDTSDTSSTPKLDKGLESILESQNINIQKLTAEQIDMYNKSFMTEEELRSAHISKVLQMENEKNAQIYAASVMTQEEIAQMQQTKFNEQLTLVGNMMGTMASLMNNGNKEMFEIGKAASIAQTTISTYLAAQESNTGMIKAFPGPVGVALGAVAAGVQIAAGIARVAQISATQFNPKGANEGIMGGFSEPLITTLKPQEIVVPQKFSEGIRRGDMALTSTKGGTGNTYVLQFGDVYGVPGDDFIKGVGQRINELQQSGDIPLGQFIGATS